MAGLGPLWVPAGRGGGRPARWQCAGVKLLLVEDNPVMQATLQRSSGDSGDSGGQAGGGAGGLAGVAAQGMATIRAAETLELRQTLARQVGSQAVLTICDSSPGVAAALRPHLMQPFSAGQGGPGWAWRSATTSCCHWAATWRWTTACRAAWLAASFAAWTPWFGCRWPRI